MALIDTLNGLRSDPTLALQLYLELFESKFYAIVRPETENSIDEMEFLTYETKDGVQELPIFTVEKFIPDYLSEKSIIIQVSGQLFWTRLLDIVETCKCKVAVNPLQPHGIRLTKEMILGMIMKYGAK
jgi:hypothetical protein